MQRISYAVLLRARARYLDGGKLLCARAVLAPKVLLERGQKVLLLLHLCDLASSE